ncbi:ATP-grasp domain-containing protein [Rheinheimera faecalis]|uniref:ATP-grasp domain-containing protein n=1 Tax=Rheinheimera faecalis TaxID=2901141 RepID=UPI001E3EF074|nr:ATP-grasp domain-containing protein [Rheinheimera faecalis]
MKIAIVEPIGSGAALVIAATQLGYESYVISYNKDDRKLPASVVQNASHIIEVDTNNSTDFEQVIKELHQQQQLNGLISGNEYYVPATAKLAHSLNLNGINPEVVDTLRHKHLMRQSLSDHGLRSVSYTFIESEQELEQAIAKVPLPAVLKPTSAAGSVHVTRVNTLNELRAAYLKAQQDQRKELGHELGRRMLLESYIQGDEFSVDGFIVNDTINILSITKKQLDKEPYFVEIGHIVPFPVPEQLQHQIETYVKDVIASIGLNIGPFHAEIRISEAGPVLIEIGARLPGDKIVELIRLSKQADLASLAIQMYCNQPVQVKFLGTGYSGIAFFIAPELSALSAIHGVERLSKIEGMVEYQITKKVGESIPEATDYRCRLGFALIHHNSFEQLMASLQAARQAVNFH